jgi:hypothetical protein
VHDDVHAAVLEELDGALAHVFGVCGAGRDDVNDTEDALFARRVSMVVVVVVVVGVIVGVVMCMPMIMAMIVCVMAVAMIVAVSVVMAAAVLVRVAMILLFGMRLCVRSAFVFEPELWHSISDYASECAKFSQCVSDTVL